LLTGQLSQAQQNPESSQATRALAGFADYVARAHQLRSLASPVSPAAKLVNLFAGNPASDAAIAQQDATAKTFQEDQLLQQHVMNNPDELAKAVADPHTYAANAQTPEFRQTMQTAVANHAEAHDPAGIAHPNGSNVIPEDPAKVAQIATTTGLTVPQAHAVTAPHQYTRDEFIKATEGMTLNQAKLLFGAQLGHVATPQEDITKTLFGTATGDYLAEKLKSQQLIEAGKTLTGSEKSKNTAAVLAQQKIEQQKLKALTDMMAPVAGAVAKPVQIPGQTE
jgi:hypothetical protein